MENLSREATLRYLLSVSTLGPEATPMLTSMSIRVFSLAARLNERHFNLVGHLLPRP